MARVRIGCSGWVYPDWKQVVYGGAPPAEWLERYARELDTVEVNSTFYRLPKPAVVESWAARSPDGFVLSPKLGQYCTHRKRLREPEQWLDRHLDRVCRLGDHLGPNLVQLPPRWRRDVGRLDTFLSTAPTTIRWAVEVRDPTWLHDSVFDCLARHGAALCLHDLIPDHPWLLTTDWTYVRFHGADAPRAPYHGRYGPDRLGAVADRFAAWRDDGVDVWAYFNNDHEAAAWLDARWLRSALEVTTGGRRRAG